MQVSSRTTNPPRHAEDRECPRIVGKRSSSLQSLLAVAGPEVRRRPAKHLFRNERILVDAAVARRGVPTRHTDLT